MTRLETAQEAIEWAIERLEGREDCKTAANILRRELTNSQLKSEMVRKTVTWHKSPHIPGAVALLAAYFMFLITLI